MIKSVDGKEDTKSIVNFINNKFLSRDTKALEIIIGPPTDMDMVFEYDNPISGEKEMTPIPMGIGFFTLPNNYSSIYINQIFEMCYYGNGYTFSDVYRMLFISEISL